MPRYHIVNRSVSCHCCFAFTVVDSQQRDEFGPVSICETFEMAEAQLVCDALNRSASELDPAPDARASLQT